MYYNCDMCKKEFELKPSQITKLLKDPNILTFCSRQCSGRYYANKSHNRTKEQEISRYKKVSDTLKNRYSNTTTKQ